MAPRRDLLLAAAAATVLIVVAFATGRAGRAVDDPDPRASSFLAGREGTRALADAAERLGVTVVRWRRRPQGLDSAWAGREATLAVLAPSVPVSEADRDALVRWPLDPRGGALVVAGESARAIVGCFGLRVESSVFDSVRVVPPAVRGADRAAAAADVPVWVHAHLAPRAAHPDSGTRRRGAARATRGGARDAARDDARGAAPGNGRAAPCPVVRVSATDTLLRDARGAPVVLRLAVAPLGRTVLVVADAALVRNRALRHGRTAAAVAAAVVPRAGVLVFDEYHQGFAPGGSMLRVAIAWSLRHPLGWMTWQLAVIAFLALLVGAWRLGPVRAAIPRRRREAREHVRALATALATAHGHREAVAALVRGLRRRLSAGAPLPGAPAGATAGRHTAAPRDDWREWLASLGQRSPSAAARQAADRLLQLSSDPRGDQAVLEAAHAVDALRDALRPGAHPA